MKGKNSVSNTEIERLKKIERVADEVIEKIGNPVSPLQVSAVIESLGYRHADCPTEFGKKNIFELSKDVYKICKLKVRAGKLRERKTKQPELYSFIVDFCKTFFRWDCAWTSDSKSNCLHCFHRVFAMGVD
jgi:hypothetical protein